MSETLSRGVKSGRRDSALHFISLLQALHSVRHALHVCLNLLGECLASVLLEGCLGCSRHCQLQMAVSCHRDIVVGVEVENRLCHLDAIRN